MGGVAGWIIFFSCIWEENHNYHTLMQILEELTPYFKERQINEYLTPLHKKCAALRRH